MAISSPLLHRRLLLPSCLLLILSLAQLLPQAEAGFRSSVRISYRSYRYSYGYTYYGSYYSYVYFPVGAIIGTVIGALCFIGFIICVIVCVCRMRARRVPTQGTVLAQRQVPVVVGAPAVATVSGGQVAGGFPKQPEGGFAPHGNYSGGPQQAVPPPPPYPVGAAAPPYPTGGQQLSPLGNGFQQPPLPPNVSATPPPSYQTPSVVPQSEERF